MGSLIEWLAAAGPPAPEEFASWLQPSDDVDVSPEALARASSAHQLGIKMGPWRSQGSNGDRLAAGCWLADSFSKEIVDFLTK